MEVFMLASEVYPLSVSELAEGVGAFAKALRAAGHAVTVVVPRGAHDEESGVMFARRLRPLDLTVAAAGTGTEEAQVLVFDGRLSSGVDVVALDLGGRDLASRDLGTQKVGHSGNAQIDRFGRAVRALLLQRAGQDSRCAIHAMGWWAALSLRSFRDETLDTDSPQARAVLAARVVASLFGAQEAMAAGQLSSAELELVRESADQIVLGPGGIDTSVWNPATDAALPVRYDVDLPDAKASCKTSLQRTLGFELDVNRPLILVEGLGAQSGGDEAAISTNRATNLAMNRALTDLVSGRNDAHWVLVPSPAPHGGAMAEGIGLAPGIAQDLAWRVKVIPAEELSQELMHRLLGAADVLVRLPGPDSFGTSLLRAWRYGVLPVVPTSMVAPAWKLEADGLLDTGHCIHYGHGQNADEAESLSGALGRALRCFESAGCVELVRAFRRRVMRLDVGWDRAARTMDDAYRQAN